MRAVEDATLLMAAAQERQFTAMGSTTHVVVIDAPDGLLDWATTEVERLERLWSRFRPDSDLCRLNAGAGTGPIAIHPMTYLAVERALQLAEMTEGRFDPTVLTALERIGYDRTFREIEPDRPLPNATTGASVPGVGGIVLDPSELTVSLPPGVRLDLGGLGKGLAADLVAEGIVDRGALGCAVGMGGDVRIAGSGPDDGRWDISVEDPTDETRTMFVRPLVEGGEVAIVSSTRGYRRWERGGREFHHLIDPATGTSADRGVHSVVVAGPEAWMAEGLAKAALVSGLAIGRELLQKWAVAGWLIADDKSVTEVPA